MYLISMNFNKFFLLLLLCAFAFTHNANANLRETSDSTPEFLSNKILLNLKNKKYKKVVQILKEKNDLSERENFLIGFALFKTNNCKDAVQYLKQVGKKENLLKPYGMFFLGKCYQVIKNNPSAIRIYKEIINKYPHFIFAKKIQTDLILLFIKEKQYGLAIRIIDNFDKNRISSKLLSDKANSHEKRGEIKKTIETWRKIWLFFPHKIEAKKAYKILREKKSFRINPFTEQQLFQRAKTLRRKYFFKESLHQLDEIVKKFPKTKLLKKIEFYRAFNLFSLRKTKDARLSFQKIINSGKISAFKKSKIRFYLSRNYLRERNRKAFENEAALILKETPKSSWAKTTLYLLARVHQDEFQDKKAKSFYKKLLLEFPDPKFIEKSKRQLAWINFRAEKYLKALKGFKEVIAISNRRELVSSSFFWAGISSEKTNNFELAIQFFQRCINRYRRNYYGHLCLDRLLKLQKKVGLKTLIVDPLKKSNLNRWFERPEKSIKNKSFYIARTFSSIGLHKFAAEEYKRSGKHRYFKFQAARSYYLSDEKNKALRIIFRSFNKILYSGGTNIPNEFWNIAYPIEKLKNKPKNTDVYLLHSIIKAESLFDQYAISPAGAIGMMQLMPKTARRVSKKYGIKFKSKFDLFDSTINKQIGAHHMQDLLKTFKGEIVPVIASYNAGRSVVLRWWKNRKNESIEVFIEQIPYIETRKYVKKVLGYYREYKNIYSKKANQ
ncbi:MAG: transglycosylase SLT domain-containing protein [Nitrospinota bacterium]|nr:transglycosylase SLT domain-containing protein [Nitrospinota bacterium]